jgi:hypothetical protein
MTPAQRLVRELERLPERSWLRRRTWLQMIQGQGNRPDQVRLSAGGDYAVLPGGVTELRLPERQERWPDMPRARVQVAEMGGTRTWLLPPWFGRVGDEYRQAVGGGQLRYEHWSLVTPAASVPVLIGRVQVLLISGTQVTVWADSSPPYWEAAPADQPDVNHPGLQPSPDGDPVTYPTQPFTTVIAAVSAAFEVAPTRVQRLR